MISNSVPGLPTEFFRTSNSPAYWLPTPLPTGFLLPCLLASYSPAYWLPTPLPTGFLLPCLLASYSPAYWLPTLFPLTPHTPRDSEGGPRPIRATPLRVPSAERTTTMISADEAVSWRTSKVNRHPIDELGDLRAAMKPMKAREKELRDHIAASNLDGGEDYFAEGKARQTQAVDLDGLRRRFGPEVEQFITVSRTMALYVRERTDHRTHGRPALRHTAHVPLRSRL